jgi:serine/threonine-protein kinase
MRRRFMREARVQGQLEHPAIVPVHDLARDPRGAAYFTMKRVRGATLQHVVDALRAGDGPTVERYTRHKLLTAFASVCLSIDFAHAHGVLHRDLKPDNVMLGDFGEVYVLDWGLAKVLPEERIPPSTTGKPRTVTLDSLLDAEPVGRTVQGAVLGTPGYMAPEQIRGDVDAVDVRADVYALGAILFELLALEPLHGGVSASDVVRSTLDGADARPSRRTLGADVPPELDAICTRATALEPADRFASAREMHDAVEAFLAGDRDHEMRRRLSREHARAAAAAAETAIASGDDVARGRAYAEVSRALALDPSNEQARRSLVRLLTDTPRELPAGARAELESHRAQLQRVGLRGLAASYFSWVVYAPIVLWMGARNVAWGALVDVLFLGAAAAAFAASYPNRRRWMDVALVCSALAIAGSAGLYGPFIVTSSVAVLNAIAHVLVGDRSRRAPAVLLTCAAILGPVVLERMGVIPRSEEFRDGVISIVPQIVKFPAEPTLVFIAFANVAVVVTASLLVARFHDALMKAEERVVAHSWQLRQLVPDDARDTSP